MKLIPWGDHDVATMLAILEEIGARRHGLERSFKPQFLEALDRASAELEAEVKKLDGMLEERKAPVELFRSTFKLRRA